MKPGPIPLSFDRRRFLQLAAAGCAVGMLRPLHLRAAEAPASTETSSLQEYRALLEGLLHDWCDALLRLQIDAPSDPATHGAFRCPACNEIHGRCGDAVYPLLRQADLTGDSRYLDAALRVVAWSKNVDQPDGSWLNDPNDRSWKGITIFAAIARAEALERHGHLLDEATKAQWRERLKRAGDFVMANFTMEYGNINYPIAAAYGLTLLGRMLDEPSFVARGRELGHCSLAFLCSENGLLCGEGRPAGKRSPKGCLPIDLGYNVEESLPNLVAYARLADDTGVMEAALASWRAHLEFMLPDGGWDNSWGTRNYKWSYWGSRTADGCHAAFVALADRDPVFATAALRHARLLRACTVEGLLTGGPHYASHGVPTCVHHTFCHAKDIASALHELRGVKALDASQPLPSETARGVRVYPEIDTRLIARGPWRATVTGNDWVYRPQVARVTGGVLGLLHHAAVGTLCAASLAAYRRIEGNNMQNMKADEVFPLTPRVEYRTDSGEWFTNLFDLEAQITHRETPAAVEVEAIVRALSAKRADPATGSFRARIGYRFEENGVTISVTPESGAPKHWRFVLPVISPRSESFRIVDERTASIAKPAGTVVVKADRPLHCGVASGERVFNPVGGFEALPLHIDAAGSKKIELTLSAG